MTALRDGRHAGSVMLLAALLVISSAAAGVAMDRNTPKALDLAPMEHGSATVDAREDKPLPPAPLAATALPAETAAPVAPVKPLFAKLRVFVASESTEQVWVLEGVKELAVVAKIPVGRLPHQTAVSPDGKWVVVNNRLSDSTSIIDSATMKEVARVKVGKQPHGVTWSVDSQTLFIAHERDTYIQPIAAGTWRLLTPIVVGVPQHVLLIGSKRPNELYFSLTNTSQVDVLRMYDLESKKTVNIRVEDVHDVYFTPDQSEIWSSSSGFIDKPSSRMVIYDSTTRAVKGQIQLTGHYPFHTLKENQDGMYFPADKSIMVLSDHLLPGLLWLDWRERKIVAETKLGQQPFHSTYDPLNDRMLVTTNVDGMVNVIDAKTHLVVQKIAVPKAHGIVSVGIP